MVAIQKELPNFELRLTSHLDCRKVDYMVNNLCFVFQLGFQQHFCKLKSATSSCLSANEHPAVIEEYLNKEISLGRVFGPTQTPLLKNLHVSRFVVIQMSIQNIADPSLIRYNRFSHRIFDGKNHLRFHLLTCYLIVYSPPCLLHIMTIS